MIRKAILQIALPALLVLMAFSAYLSIRNLRRIEKRGELTLESSAIQSNIAGVSQDLTDMETGQRGYLLTEDSTYLQPYKEAQARIKNDFASLRAGLAERPENVRSAEAQLESVAGAKQAEMERTIDLRQQGYRHRAFKMVATNEGRDDMEQVRGLVASLSAMESVRLATLNKERSADLNKALSETIAANLGLLAFTAFVLVFIRYHGRRLEEETAASRQALVIRDSRLETMASGLSGDVRTEIAVIEDNIRLLLQKYEGFLPREGRVYAEQIKEAAGQLERLREELAGAPAASLEEKAA